MKIQYYQLALESRTKPGVFRLLSMSYTTQKEAHEDAQALLTASKLAHRAPSYKVFEITRDCVFDSRLGGCK